MLSALFYQRKIATLLTGFAMTILYEKNDKKSPHSLTGTRDDEKRKNVFASEARQSRRRNTKEESQRIGRSKPAKDCFVAVAPCNDASLFLTGLMTINEYPFRRIVSAFLRIETKQVYGLLIKNFLMVLGLRS